jgi:hypothetical protein
MIQAVRSWLLLMAVTLVVAFSGFATPALAHGGHGTPPAAPAAQTTNHAHDLGKLQIISAEVSSDTKSAGAKAGAATCCGVSCMFAAPQYVPQSLIIALRHSSILPRLQSELLGRGPARLDRPPTV